MTAGEVKAAGKGKEQKRETQREKRDIGAREGRENKKRNKEPEKNKGTQGRRD